MRPRGAKKRRSGKARVGRGRQAAGRSRASRRYSGGRRNVLAKPSAAAPAGGATHGSGRTGEDREIDRLLRSLVRSAGGICHLATVAKGCRVDLPLADSLLLSIDERLVHGDVRAIRDAVAELVADLQDWIGDYDAAVGGDRQVQSRIDEVRAAKQARGELKFDPAEDGEGMADEPSRGDTTRRAKRRR